MIWKRLYEYVLRVWVSLKILTAIFVLIGKRDF